MERRKITLKEMERVIVRNAGKSYKAEMLKISYLFHLHPIYPQAITFSLLELPKAGFLQ